MSNRRMMAATLALLLIGGAASTREQNDVDRPDVEAPQTERHHDVATITGEWGGTYTCMQGVTAVRLVIAPAGERRVKALAHFFAAPENPDVPEGCFMLGGTFNLTSGDLDLGAERWVIQPTNYRMIDLVGAVDRDGGQLRGRVLGPKGCTSFALTRAKATRPLPEACEKAMR